MANFLYVGNSNVWIEGMHVSAVKNGRRPHLDRSGGQDQPLVAGDADYVPTVEHLRSRGFDVYVVFWVRGCSGITRRVS